MPFAIIPSVELQFLIGLIFVLVAGFVIGYDRGSRGAPSGVRDHTIVCLGAMLFTLMSNNIDPNSTSRIAANIVTGVGFLGAGIIMYEKGSIRGLTTAASLWVSAAIGMTIGFGYYFVAIVATFGSYFVLRLPHIGEHGVPNVIKQERNAKGAATKAKVQNVIRPAKKKYI